MKKGEKFERIKISRIEYENFKKLENRITSAKLLKRIQMLKLIYLGWKYNKVANFLNIRPATITEWINVYKNKGILKLLKFNYRGGKGKLSNEQIAELKEKASQGKFKVAKEIKSYIEKKFNSSYHLNHVQKLAKKNSLYLSKKPN